MGRYLFRRVLGALAVALAFWLLHAVTAHAATGAASSTNSRECDVGHSACVSGTPGVAALGAAWLAVHPTFSCPPIIVGNADIYTGGFGGSCTGTTAVSAKEEEQCTTSFISGPNVVGQWYVQASASARATFDANCAAPSASSCVATVGQFASGWSATTYQDLGPGLTDSSGNPLPMFGMAGGNYCAAGCVATWEATGGNVAREVGGVWHLFEQGGYKISAPGTACSASGANPTPVSTVPSNTCAAGQDGGTVNGKFVCIDRTSGNVIPNDGNGDGKPDNCQPGSGVVGGVTYTTTYNAASGLCSVSGSDGSSCLAIAPATCANAANAAPGGGVCVGLNCAVQPPTAGGASGGGDEPTADSCAANPGQDGCGDTDFCKMHPTLSVCIVSTFSGACGGTFACTGDVVTCQMAKEQASRNCSVFDAATGQQQTLATFGQSVLNGTDPLKSANPAATENVPETDIGLLVSSSIGAGEPLAAACIDDIDASFMGHPLTLPMTKFCPYLLIIGNILVAFASALALSIVARSV
jgi:hypothetical protein